MISQMKGSRTIEDKKKNLFWASRRLAILCLRASILSSGSAESTEGPVSSSSSWSPLVLMIFPFFDCQYEPDRQMDVVAKGRRSWVLVARQMLILKIIILLDKVNVNKYVIQLSILKCFKLIYYFFKVDVICLELSFVFIGNFPTCNAIELPLTKSHHGGECWKLSYVKKSTNIW